MLCQEYITPGWKTKELTKLKPLLNISNDFTLTYIVNLFLKINSIKHSGETHGM